MTPPWPPGSEGSENGSQNYLHEEKIDVFACGRDSAYMSFKPTLQMSDRRNMFIPIYTESVGVHYPLTPPIPLHIKSDLVQPKAAQSEQT